MNRNDVQPGLRVVTTWLGDGVTLLVSPELLICRECGVNGKVLNSVIGHGKDVWWVRHDESDITAPYSFHELEPLETIPKADPIPWSGSPLGLDDPE